MATLGITFVVLALMGVPLAFVLGLSAFNFAMVKGGGLSLAIPFQMFAGVDNFLFMAIPLFMLAGELMVRTGILEALLEFNRILLGRFRGSLAHVTILGSIVFAGISGSAVADASALGAILIPAMARQYDNDYGAGVVAGASTIGSIVPPSLPMILYSVAVGGISLGGLFLSGLVPGILIGVGMMVIASVQAHRRGFPAMHEGVKLRALPMAFLRVLPMLFMPFIILGGILGGIFTATESAAVAVLYAVLIGTFVTRTLTWRALWISLLQAGKISSMVFLLISTASVVSWMLAEARFPQMVASGLQTFSHDPIFFLLVLNVFLLLVGCVIEVAAAIVLFMPIIAPIASSFGISPLHLGVIVVMNLTIGLITPPVGTCLFVAAGIAKLPFERILRSMWPHLAWQIAVLLLVTYVPSVALFVPSHFGYK